MPPPIRVRVASHGWEICAACTGYGCHKCHGMGEHPAVGGPRSVVAAPSTTAAANIVKRIVNQSKGNRS